MLARQCTKHCSAFSLRAKEKLYKLQLPTKQMSWPRVTSCLAQPSTTGFGVVSSLSDAQAPVTALVTILDVSFTSRVCNLDVIGISQDNIHSRPHIASESRCADPPGDSTRDTEFALRSLSAAHSESFRGDPPEDTLGDTVDELICSANVLSHFDDPDHEMPNSDHE